MEVATSVVGLIMAGSKVTSILKEFLSSVKNAPAIAKQLDDEVTHFRYIILKIEQTVIEGESLDPKRAAMIDINHLCAALTAAVSTFSELEKELDRIKAHGKMDFWDRVKWMRAEKNLLNISLRLNRHQTSLTLVFTILTSESVTRALSSKERLSSQFDAESLDDSQDGDTTSQSNNGPMPSASTGTTFNHLVESHEFESSLSRSRAYRRAGDSDSILSLDTLRSRIGRWSMYTAYSNDSVFSMPISLREVSGISLAEKSIAPVLLPITLDTIYHNEHYRTGSKRQGLMKATIPEFILHAAAREGRYEEVHDLLRRDSSLINQKDPNGVTALDFAVDNANVLTIEILLLFGARTRPEMVRNYSVLFKRVMRQGKGDIVSQGRNDIVSKLLGGCTPYGARTILRDVNKDENGVSHRAGYSAHPVDVEFMMFTLKHAYELDPHVYHTFLTAALEISGQIRSEDCINSIFLESLRIRDGLQAIQRALWCSPSAEMISFAVSLVAELNATPIFLNALRSRVQGGSLVLIGLLFGVNTYHGVVKGSMRAFLQPDDLAMIELLPKGGADLGLQHPLVSQAYMTWLENGHQTSLHTAVISANYMSANRLLDEGFNVDAINGNGETALHLAIWKGDKMFVETLIDRGAAVNAPNILGNTPLMIAAASPNLAREEIISLLLSKGANLDAVFPSGETILHLAAVYGDSDFVLQLLEGGVNANAKDGEGRTADQCTLDKEIASAIKLKAEEDRAHNVTANDINAATPQSETSP